MMIIKGMSLLRRFRPRINQALRILCLLLLNPTFVENRSHVYVTTGTAITIIATSDQIAAAADSKVLLGPDRISSSDCKIKQCENAFFAIAGHRRAELTDFDAIYIAMEACKTTSNIADRMSKFDTLVEAALANMLRASWRSDRSYFVNSLQDKTVLQVAFFGFERGSPYLNARSYKCRLSSGQVEVEIERQGCKSQCDMLTILGKSHAIEQYISQTPSYKKTSPIELVKKFVELEIADEPDDVGPPIDVLQISKAGAVWKQKKTDCQ
jgi:hypothetical protein